MAYPLLRYCFFVGFFAVFFTAAAFLAAIEEADFNAPSTTETAGITPNALSFGLIARRATGAKTQCIQYSN